MPSWYCTVARSLCAECEGEGFIEIPTGSRVQVLDGYNEDERVMLLVSHSVGGREYIGSLDYRELLPEIPVFK